MNERRFSWCWVACLLSLLGCSERSEVSPPAGDRAAATHGGQEDSSAVGRKSSAQQTQTRSGGLKQAIVVGVNDYGPGIRDLRYAVNDATGFANRLVRDFGYSESDVQILLDKEATAANFEQAIGKLAGALPSDQSNSLIVFFAGHGAEGQIALADAPSKDPAHWYPVDRVVQAVRAAGFRHKLLILDSCFAGKLFESVKRRPTVSEKEILRGAVTTERKLPFGAKDSLDYYTGRKSFVGLTAGRATPVIDAFGDDQHSVFTTALLEAMERRAGSTRSDRAFTFSQLAAQVEAAVGNRIGARQIPDWGAIDESPGEFVFVPSSRGGRRVRLLSPPGARVEVLTSQGEYVPFNELPALDAGWTYSLRIAPGAEQPPVDALLQVVQEGAGTAGPSDADLALTFTSFDLIKAAEGLTRTRVLCRSSTLRELSNCSAARRTPGGHVFIESRPFGRNDEAAPDDLELYVAAKLNFACHGDYFELANDSVSPENDPIGVVAHVTGGDLALVLSMGTPGPSHPSLDGLSIDSETGSEPRRYKLQLLTDEHRLAFAEQQLDRYLAARLEQFAEVYSARGIEAAVEFARDEVLPELDQLSVPDDGLLLRAEDYARFVVQRAAMLEGGDQLPTLVSLHRALSRPIDELDWIDVPLNELLEWLGDETSLTTLIDQVGLEDVLLAPDELVTVHAESPRALDILDQLNAEYDIGFIASDDGLERSLQITSKEQSSQRHLQVSYYVGDLIELDTTGESFEKRFRAAFGSGRPGHDKPRGAAARVEGHQLIVTSSWRHHLAIFDTLLAMRHLSAEDTAP